MTVFVALLRGINVSGHNKIAMNDLRDLIESLPAEEVATYLQSGNVVFRASGADPVRLADAIEDRIRKKMGLEVPVMVRTDTEFDQVAGHNPLSHGHDPAQLHVTFLAHRPDRDRVAAAVTAAANAAPDTFEVVDRVAYLHCPNGYGRTKLNNTFFEKKLGVGATTRNWRTVTTLAQMLHA
jgi:uncharacterized protein (DUF1697 family)